MSLEQYLGNVLGEHFKAFIFLAYDYEGKHFVIKNYKTQAEFDALITALNRQEIEFDAIFQEQIMDQEYHDDDDMELEQ